MIIFTIFQHCNIVGKVWCSVILLWLLCTPAVFGRQVPVQVQVEELAAIIRRWPTLPQVALQAQVNLWDLWSLRQQQVELVDRVRCRDCADFSPHGKHHLFKLKLVALHSRKVEVKLVLQELDARDAFWCHFLVNYRRWNTVRPLAVSGPLDRFFLVIDEQQRPLGMLIGTELENEKQQRWLLVHTVSGDGVRNKHLKQILKIFGQEGPNLGFQKILLPTDPERSHLLSGRFQQQVARFLSRELVGDLPHYYLDLSWRLAFDQKKSTEVRAFRQAQVLLPDLFFDSTHREVIVSRQSSAMPPVTGYGTGRLEYFKLLQLLLVTGNGDDDERVQDLQRRLEIPSEQLQRWRERLTNASLWPLEDYLRFWEGELGFLGLHFDSDEYGFLWRQLATWTPDALPSLLATYQQLPPATRLSCAGYLQYLTELE